MSTNESSTAQAIASGSCRWATRPSGSACPVRGTKASRRPASRTQSGSPPRSRSTWRGYSPVADRDVDGHEHQGDPGREREQRAFGIDGEVVVPRRPQVGRWEEPAHHHQRARVQRHADAHELGDVRQHPDGGDRAAMARQDAMPVVGRDLLGLPARWHPCTLASRPRTLGEAREPGRHHDVVATRGAQQAPRQATTDQGVARDGHDGLEVDRRVASGVGQGQRVVDVGAEVGVDQQGHPIAAHEVPSWRR